MTTDLKRIPLLAECDEELRGELAEFLESLEFEPETALFNEGDPADGLLLLIEGRVNVWSSRLSTSTEIGEGYAFGALSLVAGGYRETTAETLSHCRALRLRRRDFRRMVETEPRVACALLEAILRDQSTLARNTLSEVIAVVDPVSDSD